MAAVLATSSEKPRLSSLCLRVVSGLDCIGGQDTEGAPVDKRPEGTLSTWYVLVAGLVLHAPMSRTKRQSVSPEAGPGSDCAAKG